LAVTDEAIEKIKAMITSGALRAGDRLPREADLGLRALLDRIGPDPAAEDLVDNHLEFHRRIVACSGNSVLSSLLESMSAGVGQWLASLS
jgi:GntR family transcriptional regulator, transcriptional repressor for pyruvate dehydrogenase complex